jgi:hypothetical protein
VVGAEVALASFFLFSKISFAESNCDLSAHMHRARLSAKGHSPAGLHREAFAESILSVKAPPCEDTALHREDSGSRRRLPMR